MNRHSFDRTPIEVKLRDVGRGGIGFLCTRWLPPGSSWRISFTSEGYCMGQQALVVRHCDQAQEGLYLIGAQFVLSTGLLMTLGVDPALLRANEDLEGDFSFEADHQTPYGEVS